MININTTKEKVIEGIRGIEIKGGVVDWEEENGEVGGEARIRGVKAKFLFMNDRNLRIKVTDKPFFVSEAAIEDQIKKHFT